MIIENMGFGIAVALFLMWVVSCGQSDPEFNSLGSFSPNPGVESTPISTPAPQPLRWGYVTNWNENSVSIVDPYGNLQAAKVTVGINPRSVAVSRNGDFAYVANQSSLAVIDTTSRLVADYIGFWAVLGEVALTPDGKSAYVCHPEKSAVSVVDLKTRAVTEAISVGKWPHSLAVSADGKFVYVANQSSLAQINTKTQSVVKYIGLWASPGDLALAPDATLAYVTHREEGRVSVVDLLQGKVLTTIKVGQEPRSIQVSSDGKTIYVANLSSISVINAATQEVEYIGLWAQPTGLALTKDGKALFVTHSDRDAVTKIDTATKIVEVAFPVGDYPVEIGF